MKKNSKIISLVALIIATVLAFSGCGIVDSAKSVLKNKDTEESSSAETVNSTDEYYPDATESADLVPYSESESNSENANTSSAASSNSKGNSSAAATEKKTTANKNNTSVTKAPSKNSSTATTAASSGNVPSTEEIQEMPIKEIQDMLFDTEDPNTAGKILEACGFQYDAEQGIYYSTMEPLQRLFGYNFIYDMAAPRVGMIYSTKRIQFNYGGKDWMIQLWKGQYGITAGAEIGLYNKTGSGIQYNCASNDELIEMAFDFYNQGEYVFSRGPEEHWWLTGFKIFNAGVPILIDLDITLKFPTVSMADAFEKGLKKTAGMSLTDPITYSRTAKTFKIHW